jgi:hypothetical protein
VVVRPKILAEELVPEMLDFRDTAVELLAPHVEHEVSMSDLPDLATKDTLLLDDKRAQTGLGKCIRSGET